jgi:hypothetical protein
VLLPSSLSYYSYCHDSVDTATGYRMGGLGSGVPFPADLRDFSLLHSA